MVEAFRSPKIEFVLAQHPWLESDCLFADIILPINTIFESQDIVFETEQFSTLIVEPKLIESIGESKSDYEAICEIAKKLDMYDEFTLGRTVEDWMKIGYETSGWKDLTTWEELSEKGYLVQGPDPDWKTYKPKTNAFYENPEKNPLPTPTGLIEFESTGLKENFPDDKERPPVPHWVPGGPASEGWTHDESLEWHLLQYDQHVELQKCVKDLNRLYTAEAALHELDCESTGFEWVDCSDADNSVISFIRRAQSTGDIILVVCNLTPVPRSNYRVGVPRAGFWEEILNSDAREYGGSGQGNIGGVTSAPIPHHGRRYSLDLTLPPLAALFLKSEENEP